MNVARGCFWCGAEECDCEERIACDQSGQVGHAACGWCAHCDAPMFQCLHAVREQNAKSSAPSTSEF